MFGGQDGDEPNEEINNEPNMALKLHNLCLGDAGKLYPANTGNERKD